MTTFTFFSAATLMLLAVTVANAQPQGMGGGLSVAGQTTATGCSPSSGGCSTDGSSNYCSRSLTFDTTTGIFSGSMTTNLCSNQKYGLVNGVALNGNSAQHSADCKRQTFPAYTTTPAAAPIRGSVGYSLFGAYIFGPFEAGFTTGQACSNNKGDCAAGLDVAICTKELEFECGTANVRYGMLMDDCGGHASPYHYHTHLKCDVAANAKYTVATAAASSHTPLVGIALDGRGIYGRYESGTTEPSDLDACGGHYGPVPGSNLSGVEHAGASNVYHYHTQDRAPFMLGCFGPVASLSACRALYSSTCGSEISVTTSSGTSQYDSDCPCYDKATGSNLASAVSGATTSSPGSPTSSPSSPTTKPSASGPLGAAAAVAACAFVAMMAGL